MELISGGCAGVAVDIALFPLDTIKTRVQSKEGFRKAGGFRHIFKGLGPTALGSFPGSATFFFTYSHCNQLLLSKNNNNNNSSWLPHMVSAAIGEVMACIVRVPTENVKQNLQANRYPNFATALRAFRQKGGWYNGYFSTVLRDVPFSVIQFPIWEALKQSVKSRQGYVATPIQSALFGSLSGAFAAAITTPLDVVKTRMMTSPLEYRGNIYTCLHKIYVEEGWKAWFRGIQPRVFWISIGGAVYFGAYEETKKMYSKIMN
jgi:solute carrier family 25 S-adenosylmethionine transporter 26